MPKVDPLNKVLLLLFVFFFSFSEVLESRKLFHAYRLSESNTVRDPTLVRTEL